MAKLVWVLGALALLGACKQGPGERCEVSSDCESGLTCSTGSDKVCFNPNTAVPDAPQGNGPDARIIVIPDAQVVFPDAPVVPLPDARLDAGGAD